MSEQPISATGEKLTDVQRALRAVYVSIDAMRDHAEKAATAIVDLDLSICRERARIKAEPAAARTKVIVTSDGIARLLRRPRKR